MQIKWLAKALENLNDETEYIARSDLAAARSVVQRIYSAVGLLAGNPALGHAGRIHGTREWIVPDTGYLVPYRVTPELNQIQLLRVFHTSRKLPQR